MNDSFSITQKTKGKLPSLPFWQIKQAVLGDKYELSIVFIGDKRSRDLNKKYRAKDKPTNVLSFPISKTSGEIFINLRLAKKQAPDFSMSPDNFVGKLVIHGMLHLKGFEHGSRMELTEARFVKKFFS